MLASENYNELKISPEDFSVLPRGRKDKIIYENLISIKNRLETNKDADNKFQSTTIMTNRIHWIWLFLLTVAFGLKKYIPFASSLFFIALV
jgi:hypothetical protein